VLSIPQTYLKILQTMTEPTRITASPSASGHREKTFVLFACCVPVRGACRSVLCDLQRGTAHFIPNGLYEILTEQRGRALADIKATYDHEYDTEIDEYFAFLEAKELGFWSDHSERFPPLSPAWDPPERIINALLDVDAASKHDYWEIFRQLDDLGCKAVEVRFFHRCEPDELRTLLAPTCRGRLRSIELLVGYSEELTSDALTALCTSHPRISSLVVHSAPTNITLEPRGSAPPILFRTAAIESPSCCGQVRPSYFAINIETWSEAQRWNTCLNRKISIDARGDIRNCPSMPRSFGNIRGTSLHSALAHQDFTVLWSINKDQIEICKDCEFRYICTDCRAYLTKPDDLYSKPSKCTYDPYTAEWRDEIALGTCLDNKAP
jgi:SPASM domain peptide maturase of grasp-with-spasm system